MSRAFCVNRLARQARFAAAAGTCDDRQFPQGKIDIDSLEIVLTRPTNLNAILRAWRCDALVVRNLRTHRKYSLPVKRFANFPGKAAGTPALPHPLPALLFKTRDELFALFLQFLRNHTAERVEKGLVLGEFFLPFLVIDSEKVGDRFMVDIELFQIEIVWARQPANGR